MTVLPTVRRQLQQAVERQTSRPTSRARPRLATEGLGGAMRVLLGAAGVTAALGFAILLVLLLGHRGTATHSPAASKPGISSSHHSSPLQMLDADGIGRLHFGQTAAGVDAGLARMFGRTNSDAVYLTSPHASCGFDHYSEWFGLDAKPAGFRAGHQYFRAQLTVYFKHSRFVGYEYFDVQYISRGAPGDETSIPTDSSAGRQVLHGPRLTLATTNGLVVGDPFARARQLYGRAFIVTVQPDARRDGTWRVQTPSGRIYGGIANLSTAKSFYASSSPSISAISAGETSSCR